MYVELTKARLSALVVVTAAIGYLLGLPEGANWLEAIAEIFGPLFAGDFDRVGAILAVVFGSIDWLEFAIMVGATGSAAGGTSALNQWLEVDRDGAMHRTHDRPLPSRMMSKREAFFAGVVMVAVGAGLLFFVVNPLAGFLALFTATLYVLVYTPMKARTTLNTLVGAVCGAIPPMIGWAAAAESLGLGAWLLAAILVVWQLPHFLALAWMYRDDYERGGFRMLPVIDRGGELTSQVVVVTSLMLVPLGLMMALALREPALDGSGGLVFAAVSVALGAGFVVAAVGMYRQRTVPSARRVFLASIIYLPLLLGALVLDQPRPPVNAQVFDAEQAKHVATDDLVLSHGTP